ncbi:hypothetical protein LCGC14_2235100 [marine sediment metagenome]|uniref:Uncharacterized protein n=1 Tax=marine sediment metagenome TaxID=412755 RepID=A0A0F9DUN2_9ZZZZ
MTSKKATGALAKALIAPIMQRYDYSGVARKAFQVSEICPDCGMLKEQFTDGHPWEECTVYRVMES